MASDISEAKVERPKEVQHDTAPSNITDHPFTPKGLWYTLCSRCNFSEAAHAETTQDSRKIIVEYYGDANAEE